MLYLVGTPIGNLADVTLRALEVLRSVDLVAAEDTRHSVFLLRHHGINKPLISFHEHNEARRTQELVERLRAGARVALITDAGLPGVSDPGFRLVRACQAEGLAYSVIPGPSAVLTAWVGAALSTEPAFFFGGFLPTKSGQRERELRRAAERTEASIFFESPYRLTKTLATWTGLAPERPLCVARELTKQFEEFRRGRAADLLAHYTAHPPKGEITLVIASAERRGRRPVPGESAAAGEEPEPEETEEGEETDAMADEERDGRREEDKKTGPETSASP